jgi:glycogen(starch) synthase
MMRVARGGRGDREPKKFSHGIYRAGYRRHFRPDEQGPFRSLYLAKREAVLASFEDRRSVRILDAGGGYGRLSGPLSARHRVVLLDLSREMLTEARQRCPNLVAVESDVKVLPFPEGSFDALVALDVVVHLPELEPAVQELARVLRVGGRLIIDTTNASPWWVPAYPSYVGWRPRRLIKTMCAGGVLPEWTDVVQHQRQGDVVPAMAAAGLRLEGMTPLGPRWCPKWHLWWAVKVDGGNSATPT